MFTVSLVASATAALLASSLLAAVRGEHTGPCYDPRGNIAPGFYTCNPTADTAACCPQGWACLSNSLCVATTQSLPFLNLTVGEVIRGACTSSRWNNEICGEYCLDEADRIGEMVSCGDDLFCCGAQFNDGDCGCPRYGGRGAFSITPSQAQTIVAISDASFTVSPTYARLGRAMAKISARGGRTVGEKVRLWLTIAVVASVGIYCFTLFTRLREAAPGPDLWSIDESMESEDDKRTSKRDDGMPSRRGSDKVASRKSDDRPTASTPPPPRAPPTGVRGRAVDLRQVR